MSFEPVGSSLGDPLSCIGLSVVSSTFFCSTTGREALLSSSLFTSFDSGLGADSCFTTNLGCAPIVAGTGVLVSWSAVGSEGFTGISGDGIAGGSSFCTCGASDRHVSISSSFTGGAGLGDSACASANLDGVAVGSVTRLIGLWDLSLEWRLLYGEPDRGLAAIE